MTPEPDELPDDDVAAADELPPDEFDDEDDDERTQMWTGIDTDRLRAYTDALKVVGDILWPARAGDDAIPRRRPRIDAQIRGNLELAVSAIAIDMRRLTTFVGPHTHREGE